MLRILALVVIAGIVAYPVFSGTRSRAGASRHARARLLATGVAGIAVGALLALWLPRRIPETSGSPASLVAVVLLWILGGTLAFLSAAGFAGALVARPGEVER